MINSRSPNKPKLPKNRSSKLLLERIWFYLFVLVNIKFQNLKYMKSSRLILLVTIIISLFGCKDSGNKVKGEEHSEQITVEIKEDIKAASSVIGNYVSSGYAQKDEGYDWVAVAVTEAGNEKLKIKVRSRADIKKPTCTFDAIAERVTETTYKSMVDEKTILYVFENGSLTIAPEKPEFKGALAFYCSGGGSVANSYSRIGEDLDFTQIDRTSFRDFLMLQEIAFRISSIEKEGKNTLTVSPSGLEISNEAVDWPIEGMVTKAEIEDLNSDGSPEVLVYTRSEDSHEYGNVYGYSTNNKKSMSFIYFPPTAENEQINQGYEGHDEFAIVETSLVQRFPIYDNGSPTGKMRQVIYKLKEGEASRRLVVEGVTEY